MIDTASTCGDAEILVGAEVVTSNLRDKIPTPRRPRRSLVHHKKGRLLQLHKAKTESVAVQVQRAKG